MGDYGERGPAGGIGAGAVDGGAARGDVEPGDAFVEPWDAFRVQYGWHGEKMRGGVGVGSLVYLHMSKKGPPFNAVQAISPAEAFSSKYRLTFTLSPTKSVGKIWKWGLMMSDMNSLGKKSLTRASIAASINDFWGLKWVAPPGTQHTTASWPCNACTRDCESLKSVEMVFSWAADEGAV